jgi:hypothetical protein
MAAIEAFRQRQLAQIDAQLAEFGIEPLAQKAEEPEPSSISCRFWRTKARSDQRRHDIALMTSIAYVVFVDRRMTNRPVGWTSHARHYFTIASARGPGAVPSRHTF